jgi:hypothetical protein
MSELNRKPIRIMAASLRVMRQRLAYYFRHRNPAKLLLFLLVEGAGVILFASGVLSTLAFLSTETPAEAAHRLFAKMPSECEAGFLNHGAYTCWYTISDHPLLFALSLTAMLVGGAIMVWAQRHWFPPRGKIGA